MKKTTTFRQSALVGAPGMASGFVPSIANAIKISVNLRNVDIKIYGFTGSQWELLHDTDGLINSYVTDVVHQKYYFESKTGVEQTVSASFLSSDSRNIEQPRFGVSRDTRKLHDIEEVPLYNSEDAGKFLTVMSDGSLAWLAESESYIVESEGGDGGEDPQVIAGTFLEELAAATSNLYRSAHITNGIFTQTSSAAGEKGATKVDLNVEGVMNYTNNSLDPKEWTLSFWIAAEEAIGGGYNYCGGRFNGSRELRLAVGKTTDGFLQFNPIIGDMWTGTPKAKSTIPFAVGQFHHCAITYSLSDGFTDKYDLKIFIDGVKGGEALQKTFHVLDLLNGNIWFGIGMSAYGGGFNGNGGMFSIDSVQVAHGALTEAQVAAIAAQSDRQMSIETAALQ